MLYLLAIIPLLALLFYAASRARLRRLRRFGDRETVEGLMPGASPRRVRNKFTLYLCAVGLLIIALARPQFGSKLKEQNMSGVEIMFVVDVSNSMLAQDFEPSRLERTKYSIIHLLDDLHQDRVGLIVFAGTPYVQLPITSDYVTARNFISQASPNMVSRQGTAIGAAINLAAGSFSSDSEGSRVIILVSDGENHEDDAISAAQAAKEKGIVIYTVGIGTPEGAPISINGDFLKDDKGDMVVSKLDEKTLEDIALTTGGAYIRAANNNIGLKEIADKVKDTQQKRFKSSIFEEYDEQFQYFIGGALLLLLIESLMLRRKNRVLARFNIFK
jgi:Ca-activated chloride channel family protein